jgi:hypothetical protein
VRDPHWPFLAMLLMLFIFGLAAGLLVGVTEVLLVILFALFVVGVVGGLSWRRRRTPPII